LLFDLCHRRLHRPHEYACFLGSPGLKAVTEPEPKKADGHCGRTKPPPSTPTQESRCCSGEQNVQSEERLLSNRIIAAAIAAGTASPLPNPADKPVNSYPNVGGGASATKRGFGRLLTIDIPAPPAILNYISAALAVLTPIGGAASQAQTLLANTILQEGHAEISADWQHDGLEIWSGFAGLTSAKGFESVFGHRANVQLLGTIYGNYLPGVYLISMSGNVNPVGPAYIEFRCAAVIQAGKPIQPLFGQTWDRDTGRQTDLRFSDKTGFALSVSPY
jgi:hypothetical protein